MSGAQAGSAPEAVTVRSIPRPGHLGPVSVTQIVVVEAVVLVTAAVAARGLVAGLIAGAVSAVVLGVCLARRRGRWWLEDLAISWQHRRRRAAARDTGMGAVLSALRSIAPGLSVTDVTVSDGARVGVGRDEGGWFSVVTLEAAAGTPSASPALPLDTLVSTLAAHEQPGVVLQLISHTVPAPGPEVHLSSPAGGSYRALVESLSQTQVPAHRESLLCLRVDARAFAEALLDHTADPESAAALVGSLARRAATSLRRIGVPCRVLDAGELVGALARSCDVEPGVVGDAAQVREEWTGWHSARLVHRTYWLKSWPGDVSQFGALTERVSALRVAQTSTALILEPTDGDDLVVRAFIRIAARPEDDLDGWEGQLFGRVHEVGAELLRMDGEQGPAAYATAPTGGGAG